eukprot:11343227-Ditylum_brightwellii.AAC.1
MKNIKYFDLQTNKVKTATHVKCDEGMNDLVKLTPNAKQLQKALSKPREEEQHKESVPDHLDMQIQGSPFTELIDIKLNIKCDQDNLGLILN